MFLEDEDEEDKVQKQVEEKNSNTVGAEEMGGPEAPVSLVFFNSKTAARFKKREKNPRNPGSMKKKILLQTLCCKIG